MKGRSLTPLIITGILPREALDAVKPNERLWTIDRAFQPGVQRFGVSAWTGDIRASWSRLASTPADLLNWGLAGMPYASCDIGGHVGETNPELLTRWMEAGVYFPVMRTHSTVNVKPHFPWLFGPEAEDAIRKALQRRYELIPVYYSLAYEAHETGMPIMRPLFTEFPKDPLTENLSSEWLIGRGLLAAPILAKGGGGSVYLPDDRWYRFGTGEMTVGPTTIGLNAKLDEIPAFVRRNDSSAGAADFAYRSIAGRRFAVAGLWRREWRIHPLRRRRTYAGLPQRRGAAHAFHLGRCSAKTQLDDPWLIPWR